MSVPGVKPRRFDRDVDGILLLDKPLGLSSNDALQQARRLYRALKAGHAGSLDPLASGMLPVCFGQATKVCAFLLDARKTYEFTARLGERTATGDAEGEIVERCAVPTISADLVQSTLQSFLGKQQQIPPMYSALKHEGQRLYAIARRGETVEREAREIVVEAIDAVRVEPESITVTVRCSKGTYVRTLAEDIAVRLGTVAHLTALRRTQVDPFARGSMRTFTELEGLEAPGQLESILLPADQALLHLAAWEAGPKGEEAVLRGQAVPFEGASAAADYVRMYGAGGRFLGLGEVTPDRTVQPRRLLVKSAINP